MSETSSTGPGQLQPWFDRRFRKVPLSILQRPDLSSTAKLVYSVICDRIGKNGHAWPGLRKLAKDIGMSHGAVSNAVDELVQTGLLVVEKGKGTRTNRYRLPASSRTRPEPQAPTGIDRGVQNVNTGVQQADASGALCSETERNQTKNTTRPNNQSDRRRRHEPSKISQLPNLSDNARYIDLPD